MQKQAEVSEELAKVGGELNSTLKQLAARNIGNRSATWDKAYDQLIKVNEASLIGAIMRALKVEVAKEVEKSKLLTRKRVRGGVQGLGLARVEEKKEGGPSMWMEAWSWLPWGGKRRG